MTRQYVAYLRSSTRQAALKSFKNSNSPPCNVVKISAIVRLGFAYKSTTRFATFFGCGQNGVGRDEPDTTKMGVEFYKCFRLV